MTIAPVICENPNYIYCGSGAGCIPANECCLGDEEYLGVQGAYTCNQGATCYTISSSFIGCQWTTASASPTKTAECLDLTQETAFRTGPDPWFRCDDPLLPYCRTYLGVVNSGRASTTSSSASQRRYTFKWCYSTNVDGISTVAVMDREAMGSVRTTSTSTSSSYTPTQAPSTTPTETSQPAEPSIDPGPIVLTIGSISGIAIGSFIVFALIGILSFFAWRKHTRKRAQTPLAAEMPVYHAEGPSANTSPPPPAIYNNHQPPYQPLYQPPHGGYASPAYEIGELR